jgi:hypothetical protein
MGLEEAGIWYVFVWRCCMQCYPTAQPHPYLLVFREHHINKLSVTTEYCRTEGFSLLSSLTGKGRTAPWATPVASLSGEIVRGDRCVVEQAETRSDQPRPELGPCYKDNSAIPTNRPIRTSSHRRFTTLHEHGLRPEAPSSPIRGSRFSLCA